MDGSATRTCGTWSTTSSQWRRRNEQAGRLCGARAGRDYRRHGGRVLDDPERAGAGRAAGGAERRGSRRHRVSEECRSHAVPLDDRRRLSLVEPVVRGGEEKLAGRAALLLRGAAVDEA